MQPNIPRREIVRDGVLDLFALNDSINDIRSGLLSLLHDAAPIIIAVLGLLLGDKLL